jgi:hypothetical protein
VASNSGDSSASNTQVLNSHTLECLLMSHHSTAEPAMGLAGSLHESSWRSWLSQVTDSREPMATVYLFIEMAIEPETWGCQVVVEESGIVFIELQSTQHFAENGYDVDAEKLPSGSTRGLCHGWSCWKFFMLCDELPRHGGPIRPPRLFCKAVGGGLTCVDCGHEVGTPCVFLGSPYWCPRRKCQYSGRS